MNNKYVHTQTAYNNNTMMGQIPLKVSEIQDIYISVHNLSRMIFSICKNNVCCSSNVRFWRIWICLLFKKT